MNGNSLPEERSSMLVWRPAKVDTVRLSGCGDASATKTKLESWAAANGVCLRFCGHDDGVESSDGLAIRIRLGSEKGRMSLS